MDWTCDQQDSDAAASGLASLVDSQSHGQIGPDHRLPQRTPTLSKVPRSRLAEAGTRKRLQNSSPTVRRSEAE
ncbi:hypothetical protein PGT21_036323 [Puccinia graminis f. sp. tritici]|nr:hypothetical protein PGT21_036323 [Puccinia graminis f. sp. tritici]